MATLEKIREKRVLLLVLVGGAMFAFVLGDFLTNTDRKEQFVAEIEGEKISALDFQNKIETANFVYEVQTGKNISGEDAERVRNSVWETTKKEIILGKEFEEIGISVSDEELKEMVVGQYPHQYVVSQPMFRNQETGQFDRNLVVNFINSLNAEGVEDPAQLENINKAKSYWSYIENAIKQQKLEEKYFMLIGKAMNATSLEAQYAINARKETADVNYVAVPYTTIADEDVAVSESEIKARYKEQKENFKQSASVDFSYVVFKVAPSRKDYDEIEEFLNVLVDEYKTTTDVVSFVNENSDELYSNIKLSENEIDPDFKTFAFSGKKGEVSGPIWVDQTYKMARIESDVETYADSVKVRGILVIEDSKERSKELADSIVNAVNGGADFEALTAKYSKMGTSDMGWFTETTLSKVDKKIISKEMAEKIFANKDGKAFAMDNFYGTQIVQVVEKTAPVKKVLLSVVSRNVIISDETEKLIYDEANQFSVENRTLAAFESAANEKGYFVRKADRVDPMTYNIAGLNESRNIVTWANSAEKNQVSDVLEVQDAFVVAVVRDKHEAGYATLAEASSTVKSELMLEKKQDKLVSDLAGKSFNSLQAVAEAYNTTIGEAKSVSVSNARLQSLGYEPIVGAAVAKAQEGVLNGPVKGQNAAIYYVVSNKQTVSTDVDVKNEVENMSRTYMYRLPYLIMPYLNKEADVEDSRAKFY